MNFEIQIPFRMSAYFCKTVYYEGLHISSDTENSDVSGCNCMRIIRWQGGCPDRLFYKDKGCRCNDERRASRGDYRDRCKGHRNGPEWNSRSGRTAGRG